MPGTILDVKVAVGQGVKKGDVLCILEAMKLENEIRASRDGSIAGTAVSKGSNVNAGDTLVTVDFDKVKEAGYSTTTLMTVLNTAALAGVTPKTGVDVQAGQEVLDIQR